MLETVLSDGSFLDNPVGRAINPGHSCESAWFLLAEFLATGDPRIRDRALQLLDWSLNMGWDSMCGGIFYFVDVKQRPCEQLEWDMKLWWVHNEALIATLLAYHITENQKYWNWFKKIHTFAFSNFPDRKFGEWYGYLHRDGSVSHTQKGSLWKGPFHLPRCLMLCEEILHSISEGTSLSLLL